MLILYAELELCVQLPLSYKEFVSNYGAAVFPGFEIAGLIKPDTEGDSPPFWQNIITSTLRLRRLLRGNLPNDYVFISDDGGDHKYYLATSRMNFDGECPVVVLGPGADSILVAENFIEFVKKSVEAKLTF